MNDKSSIADAILNAPWIFHGILKDSEYVVRHDQTCRTVAERTVPARRSQLVCHVGIKCRALACNADVTSAPRLHPSFSYSYS